MAFKRSAVRSRLSPPENGHSEECPFFFAVLGYGESCYSSNSFAAGICKTSAILKRVSMETPKVLVGHFGYKGPGTAYFFCKSLLCHAVQLAILLNFQSKPHIILIVLSFQWPHPFYLDIMTAIGNPEKLILGKERECC